MPRHRCETKPLGHMRSKVVHHLMRNAANKQIVPTHTSPDYLRDSQVSTAGGLVESTELGSLQGIPWHPRYEYDRCLPT